MAARPSRPTRPADRSATKQFGPDGCGHWPLCYTVLFAGGGKIPGAIHGSSDRLGAYPATDPVTPDDIAATMFWALGIDPATEVRDTLNRPHPIAAGQPVTAIFGKGTLQRRTSSLGQ